MRVAFVLTLFFSLALNANSVSTELKSQVVKISSLVDSGELELAQKLISELKEAGNANGNFWLTKSNFLLGNISKKEGDYARAIIYYLEAIRYAKGSSYEKVNEDLMSLHNECGIIFKRFKAYTLAEEYLVQGVDYSINTPINSSSQSLILYLNYNLAGLYRDTQRFTEAVNLLENSLLNIERTSPDYLDFKNRLALTYRKFEKYDKSIAIYQDLLGQIDEDNWRKRASYHHNLAKSHKAIDELQEAQQNYLRAIEFKSLNENKKSLFSSYFGLAETHFKMRDLKNAKINFNLAEELMSLQPKHPDYFELYSFCADLNYELRDYEEAKKYNDLYSKSLNEYLDIQAELQESEQRINMDLITKRYFAEVKKQDRIAEIMFASQLTSGSLLTLLLLVIGYHRYQKISLRRSIERELVSLNIID